MNILLIKNLQIFLQKLSPEKAPKTVIINLFPEKFTLFSLDKYHLVVRNLIARSIESFEFFQSPSLPEFL